MTAASAGAQRSKGLLALTLLYGVASLLHHVHNAIYLRSYPNLPPSLSAARVFMAWFATTCIGAVGYLLVRRGYAVAGPLVLAAYGALGLFGLAHYALAPPSAHSPGMNASILFEVAAATALLVAIVKRLLDGRRSQRGSAAPK